MRYLILLVVLLVPALVFGQVDPPKTDSRVTFRDEMHGYSLDYSDKWTPLESEDEGTRIILVSTSEAGSLEAYFSVITINEGDLIALSSDEYADMVLKDPEGIKKNALESNPTATAIEFRKSKIGGTASVEIKYRFVDDGGGKEKEVIEFENNFLSAGRIYFVTFIIEATQFEKWTPEINAINSSFKITPPKPAAKSDQIKRLK